MPGQGRPAPRDGAGRRARGCASGGIVEEPPPEPSESSVISGRESVATSAAIRPHASVQVTRASPTRVTSERAVCHGGATGSPSDPPAWSTTARAAVGEPASSTPAARVPAAPPACRTSRPRVRSVSSQASATEVIHVASFTPAVTGTAYWVSVRPTAGSSRWVVARSASLDQLCPQLGIDSAERVAQQQDQRGVDHVLAGEAAVQPAGDLAVGPLTQQRDEPAGRVAGGRSVAGQQRDVVVPDQSRSVLPPAAAGATPVSTSASSQACSTASIAANTALPRPSARRRVRRRARRGRSCAQCSG